MSGSSISTTPMPGKTEFVALCALLMALNALAIDIMLPGLQQIGESLNVENPNHRQLIVTAYLLGLGAAQLIYGPISDRLGRKIPMLGGLLIYVICSYGCTLATSFSSILLLRLLQGAGAAATRVLTISIVRDVHGGRKMAEISSLIMMVFMIVPVIAPSIGQFMLLLGHWHGIFLLMAAAGLLMSGWMWFRLPETLSAENKRNFTPAIILNGFKIVLTNRLALCYAIASAFIFGSMFGFVNSAQQIYVGIYGLGKWFPVAFAAVAMLMAVSAFMNARFVMRFGTRRLSHGALVGFIITTCIWLIVQLSFSGPMPFALFLLFFAASMFQFGWIGANFNALAMEPLGHVAGTASSVLGFMGTVGGASIGALIGQAFNGTATPLIAGYFILGILSLLFVLIAEKGKLFAKGEMKQATAVADVH